MEHKKSSFLIYLLLMLNVAANINGLPIFGEMQNGYYYKIQEYKDLKGKNPEEARKKLLNIQSEITKQEKAYEIQKLSYLKEYLTNAGFYPQANFDKRMAEVNALIKEVELGGKEALEKKRLAELERQAEEVKSQKEILELQKQLEQVARDFEKLRLEHIAVQSELKKVEGNNQGVDKDWQKQIDQIKADKAAVDAEIAKLKKEEKA